jgi:hypothetical protein
MKKLPMAMPTASVVITTTNLIIVRAIPTGARVEILRFGAENVDTKAQKIQLQYAAKPVKIGNRASCQPKWK